MNDVRSIPVHLLITAVPYVGASDVTVTSSSGRAVPPGEPVEAGDRLTIAVEAYDAQRLPISRQDLQLTVVVNGTVNGGHSVPLELGTAGANVYTAKIPETWIKEPETVESDVLPSSVAATTPFRSPRPCRVVRSDSIVWRALTLARAAYHRVEPARQALEHHVLEDALDC